MSTWNSQSSASTSQLVSMKQPEPLLHPGIAAVYRKKVVELVSALDSADVEARESARTEIRVLTTAIVFPEGDEKLRVEGNLRIVTLDVTVPRRGCWP